MLKWFAISVLALLCLGTAAGDDDFNHTASVDLFRSPVKRAFLPEWTLQ